MLPFYWITRFVVMPEVAVFGWLVFTINIKRGFFKIGVAISDLYFFEILATSEIVDFRQVVTAIKCTVSDTRRSCGKNYPFEVMATVKRIFTYP